MIGSGVMRMLMRRLKRLRVKVMVSPTPALTAAQPL